MTEDTDIKTARSYYGIVSMIAGIFGVIFSMSFLISWPLGLIAIFLGMISLNKIKVDPAIEKKGFAIAGIVLGVLSLIFPFTIGNIITQLIFYAIGHPVASFD